MRLRGAVLDVSTVTQNVSFAEPKCPHSLRNDHATDSVFFRSTYKNSVTFAGTEAEVKALHGAEIGAKESVTLPPLCGEIEIVCGTTKGNASVRVTPGRFQPVST